MGYIEITIPMSINRNITPNASRAIKPLWKSGIQRRMREKAVKATEEWIRKNGLTPFTDDELPLTIHILWAREKHRKKMDNDNLIASCKWFIDGIAESIGVNDRNFVIGTVTQERDTIGKGYIKIVVEGKGKP